MLELKNVTKEFPGTKALDRVSLKVEAGQVVALLGENGAGKSTLMKILSGVWPHGSFEGEIFLDGRPCVFNNTRDSSACGIGMIHQELSVFPELTVSEHLALDQLSNWIEWDALHQKIQTFLDSIGFDIRASQKVKSLSVGGRQLVEIARALYRNARVIVFDEPTSALTESEVVRLYSVIDRLRSNGHGIIYITHRMDEVFRLADQIVVLRDGQNAGTLPTRDETHKKTERQILEPQIIKLMVGRELKDIYPPKNRTFGQELLRVEGLTLKSEILKTSVSNLSFSLKKGEILGLGGLLGAGRSETLELLFGALHPHGPKVMDDLCVDGMIWIKGQKQARPGERKPSDAISARMAFVSEDRKATGLILNQSIQNNAILASLGVARLGIQLKNESKNVERWTNALKVKAASLSQPVMQLSGGNQQKVVLAKWLLTDPEILFLDEPTRGIDIGSKVEIYQWIQKLSEQGLGIILASSELPELLGLCHRVLVLREGHLSKELAENASQEDFMKAASL